uniref:Integrin alpha-IIb, Integrin beta-3, transmembrane signaling, protein structure n=1 Tax=Inoviridae sp. ctJfE44 TaxID=2825779 RepID=A0A8S5UB90_9VIRU|nr:MAG TPA: Integrin alpha-IIb, Integrin beta-3, transmembrane signaling, protein structure [Inoviridae sp. ctJfE44]DAX03552.1 MAG TPA: Integrin alpha-IIb, Integrin beta-3, transmembrane signaling, protein structure [Inoviridae sp.]
MIKYWLWGGGFFRRGPHSQENQKFFSESNLR